MAVVVNTVASTPGAALTDLYTVPASKRANVKLLQVTNIAGAGKTFRLAVSPNGDAIANAHYLAYDMAVAANDNVAWGDFLLGETDVVRVYGSDANVQFMLSFYEDDV